MASLRVIGIGFVLVASIQSATLQEAKAGRQPLDVARVRELVERAAEISRLMRIPAMVADEALAQGPADVLVGRSKPSDVVQSTTTLRASFIAAGTNVPSPADLLSTEAFRAFILECAQRAAEAAKECGFMGFRAELVSQGEKNMLEQLKSVLG